MVDIWLIHGLLHGLYMNNLWIISGYGWYTSGNDSRFAIEHGPVEIVSVPSNSMVIFGEGFQ